MTTDPRLLTAEQLTAIGRIADGERFYLVVLAVKALLRHIEAVTEQSQADREQSEADRVIVELAEKLVGAKRAGDLAFGSGGIRNAADLIDGSARHRRIAQRVRDAGNALARALEERKDRERTS